MDEVKRKISVTLDADLLAELAAGEGSISAQLNVALRAEIRRRRQADGWQRILDEMLEADGPLDTLEDIEAMARIAERWRELDRIAAEMAGDDSTDTGRQAS